VSQFNPWPYVIPGPTTGGGMPQQQAPQAPPAPGTVVVAHSREIDLRTIAGDVDPPITTTIYQQDYLLLVPADCALQRLRLSGDGSGAGVSFGFTLIQLAENGTVQTLVPDSPIRQLDIVPTDFETVPEILPDVPILLRVQARYQRSRVFVTLEALYTSAEA
jgi:hypothetical protein